MSQSQRVSRLRRLAEEARAEAQTITNLDSRRALEEIARAYDELADDAERVEAIGSVEEPEGGS